MERPDWRFWWKIIYHSIALSELLPQRFPLPEKFWGRLGKKFGKDWERRQVAKFLALGPDPRRTDVNSVVGYGPGDTDDWLNRRARYLIGKPS